MKKEECEHVFVSYDGTKVTIDGKLYCIKCGALIEQASVE